MKKQNKTKPSETKTKQFESFGGTIEKLTVDQLHKIRGGSGGTGAIILVPDPLL